VQALYGSSPIEVVENNLSCAKFTLTVKSRRLGSFSQRNPWKVLLIAVDGNAA